MSNAARVLALFAGSDRSHGTHGQPEKDGLKWSIRPTAETIRAPATVETWEQHLRGERPLGIVPVRQDGTCVFGMGDLDLYDANLVDIICRVEAAKLPLVPVQSKSGGLHLVLLLARPMPAAAVGAALRAMMVRLGYPQAEVFPKQAELEADKLGRWNLMPYFGGDFGGKLRPQVALRRSGAAMTRAEFLNAAEASRVEELPAPAKKERPPEETPLRAGEEYAIRMLTKLSKEVAKAKERTRNNTLNSAAFQLFSMVARDWVEADGVESEMTTAAVKCGLPMDELREVLARARADGERQPHADLPVRRLPRFERVTILENGDEVLWSFTFEDGAELTMNSDTQIGLPVVPVVPVCDHRPVGPVLPVAPVLPVPRPVLRGA